MLPVHIGTAPGREPWLNDCLTSIRATTDRVVTVHTSGGYELAALRSGATHHDRFLFLHDTVTILSPQFWNVIDWWPGTAWLTGWPPMFMGIHDRISLKVLDRFPDSIDKADAIRIEAELPTLLDYSTIWPDITDATALRQEHRHGRDNLVLGNNLFEKHKGTWA